MTLGGDPADDEDPDKPKRMRWATHNHANPGVPRRPTAAGRQGEPWVFLTGLAFLPSFQVEQPNGRVVRQRWSSVLISTGASATPGDGRRDNWRGDGAHL